MTGNLRLDPRLRGNDGKGGECGMTGDLRLDPRLRGNDGKGGECGMTVMRNDGNAE